MSQHSTEIKPNLLDKIIGWFSPQRAYERMMYRQGYQAAGIPRRHQGWVPIDGRAEQINGMSREMLRRKARDLERNSDMANSIIGAYVRNVVGSGFVAQADTGDEELNRRMEAVFEKWQRPENCDITGSQSFLEMCNMVVRRLVVDGGILFVKVNDGPHVPFQLQAREVSDLNGELSTAYTENRNAIVGGVEVNEYGKPMAYHIKIITGDGWDTGNTKRLEAKQVIALWQKHTPSQIREVTPMAVTINRIADTEDFIDTVSLKEKILACFAVFIKRMAPTMTGIGRCGPQEERQEYTKKSVTPGIIQELQPGDDVQAVVPNGQAANAREMVTLFNRMTAAGQGLSYEAVSRDMSQVNYSSARQGLLEDKKTYQRLQRFLIDHFLDEVYESVIVAAVTSGELFIPDFWEKKDEYLNHSWTLPGWSWIDPVKEVNANQIAIASGQDTLAAICASRGQDWQDVMRQRAKELALQKELEAEYGVSFTGGSKDEQTEPNAETTTSTDGENPTSGDDHLTDRQ